MTQGLELSERYFRRHGLPMIRKKFPSCANRIAAGLVGDGSECFGVDDRLSRDHDWGPAFCLWLTADDCQRFGAALGEEVARLPRVFEGHGPRRTSAWGGGRTGVLEIAAFYEGFTGLKHPPCALTEWLALPETSLAAATNGRVFHDPLGQFSRWRTHLLDFYPDDVRLKKIASRCMTIAQSGQYNYPRCVKRNERYAAQYAQTKFCADVLSMVFLFNRVYTPFYKWTYRLMSGLPVLGRQIHACIGDLVTCHDTGRANEIIEDICAALVGQLRAEGLTESRSAFLLDHGPHVQRRIRDQALRARNVWVD